MVVEAVYLISSFKLGVAMDKKKAKDGGNVIDFFSWKNRGSRIESQSDEPTLEFGDAMIRNQKNRDRMRLDRSKANERVLRSYRIKKK